MLKLNILSPELKKEVKYKFFYNSLKNILYLLLISILTHASLLVTAKYVLDAHSKETNSRNILITGKTEDYDKKVKNINEQVGYIAKIQEETIDWLKFMDIFSQSVTKGITIQNLSLNQKSDSFNLNGVAATRQDLLNFKASLEKTDLFKEINIPISSLLEKENIVFSFNTGFKSYDFK